MESKQFKAESKRLLDMMINSIYTHREIFLRELISNASDAIDKLYFISLTDDKVGLSKDDFAINISCDKDARTLTITDNGIGMSRDELENNLGTIAASGSLAFKQENSDENIDIIGQFGVGFYSAFMVSKKVTVLSKAYGSDTAYIWQSEGVEGYTIDECAKSNVGTEIILELKDDTDDDKYGEYLEPYKIRSLVKKYSDYIRFPIKMEMEKTRLKGSEDAADDKEPEYETYREVETLNSMVPIWRKNKNELTDEEYNKFYKEKYYDYTDPMKHMHIKTEGTATYDALLFIPSKAPYDYYSKEYEKGLQLFSSGVMIMDKCADLLPDCFSFVKGLVDSADLSLNISREMLQHDRQLKIIAKSIEKSIKNELVKLLKNDREKYEEFWKNFGLQIKFGIYNAFGADKELLQDLLMFSSSMEKKLVTLDEYCSRMKEDQKYIFYACGDTVSKTDALPQVEAVKDKGYEILYLTENVDEFVVKVMMSYKEKEFKSVSASDLELETQEEKEAIKQQQEDNAELLKFICESLGGKVKEARLSQRLKSHPVCLSADGQLSIEMEKVLATMPNAEGAKAEKVLEINASHPVFATMRSLFGSSRDKVADYAKILYNQALLIEGMPIEDPVEYSNLVCSVMSE